MTQYIAPEDCYLMNMRTKQVAQCSFDALPVGPDAYRMSLELDTEVEKFLSDHEYKDLYRLKTNRITKAWYVDKWVKVDKIQTETVYKNPLVNGSISHIICRIHLKVVPNNLEVLELLHGG